MRFARLNELMSLPVTDGGAQESLMKKFGLGDEDAQDVLVWLAGKKDWEDLGDAPREKLMSHYEKSNAPNINADKADPDSFVKPALKADLGL